MRFVLTFVIEVVDGIAVSQYDSIVAPLVAQNVNQQTVAGTTWFSLKPLISTHHLAHVTFLNQCFECWQIGLPQVAVGWLYIHRVAQGFWSAVHSIVLGTSVGFKVFVVVALHTKNGLHTKHGVQIGVLTACFLTASPAWVTEDVDVWTPEGEFWVAWIVNHSHWHVKQFGIVVVSAIPVGARLIRHLRENIVEQLGIECSSHSDGLWIDGIAALSHTMTSLAPPVVAGNTQAVDRNRLVHHQPHLLLRCE